MGLNYTEATQKQKDLDFNLQYWDSVIEKSDFPSQLTSYSNG